ncbi:ABC transporter permease [Aeromicrobium sp. CTD01-1L150]|uniref:ABC transporter permease n=1 Tax=Aeromicrobium sp. CTD01-1L150 TaxID=3341830 RepID=UPI0035BEE3B7
MRRVTWRNLLARKVRLLLSAFAIVLGVAFVAGSFVFTDTIERSFEGIVSGSVPDVTVRPVGLTQDSMEGSVNLEARTMPASLVDELAGAPGVARADGSIDGVGLFVVRADGRLLGGTGAPTLSFNYNDAPNTLGEPAVTISEGREPRAAGEIALDERSAQAADYSIGDTVRMVTAGEQPEVEAELVGIAEFAGGGLAGATLVLFETGAAQDVFLGGADAFTSVSVAGEPGVSETELADAVGPLLPEGVEAATGQEVADEIEGVVGEVLGFLNAFLLVFGAIALVVGTFLIVNTFSILVAQRSRELALLRALGASRRQVTRSVLTEAFAVGLVGATLGLLLGFGLAASLRLLFASFGLDLSGTSLVFKPRTAVAAYLVGLVVTMVAAYLPARRAARIAPVAAMRDDVALPDSSVRRRTLLAVALVVVGALLLVWGLVIGGDVPLKVGAGIFCILIAISLASPVLAVPVLSGTGLLYRRVFGTVGTLATQNARRNPRRTAATASALMIGLALVSTMSVIGASVNKSIDAAVEKDFTSDYLVSNAVGIPFSPAIAERLAALDDVDTVAPVQALTVSVGDDRLMLSATDVEAFSEIFDLEYVEGGAPSDGEVALTEDTADQLGVGVGQSIDLTFPSGDVPATVVGVYEFSNVAGSALAPLSTVAEGQLQRTDSSVAVNAAEGADTDQVGRALEAATAQTPTVTVQNQSDFAEAQRAQVDQLLLLIYALLGLAIVIAVLGIVNTLALSVMERTREVGLLRAVGLSRRQLRRMVRLEAIAIAVLGAVLGIAAGVAFGVLLQRSFVDDGITDLAIPWPRLVTFVVVAAVVGVLAAVLPARRAARLDVLRAITTE